MLAGVGNQQSVVRGQLSLLSFIRMSLDPTLIVGSLIVITIAWGETFDGPDLVLALIAFSLTFPGSLSLVANPWTHLKDILVSWAVIVLILLFFGYATKYLGAFNPIVLATWIAFVPVVLYVAHRTAPLVLPKILKMEGYRTAVIVGLTEPGRRLAEEFARSRFLGVKLLGFFDDRGAARLGEPPEAGVKGKLAELPAFVKAHGVEAIFIALPMASQPRILRMLDELRDTTTSIYFVPDMFMTDLIQARMDDVNGIPVVAVCESPFYGVNGVIKRLEDIVLGTLILAAVSPLLLAVAIGVKLTSPGPVLFRQRRYGLDGKEITVYKFRSMRVMEDGEKVPQATKNDPRVTRFGSFIRRTSLDELPQFVNVLQGRMSIVGPRPHAVAHNETYRKVIKGYMVRHKVKPGITGLAQIHGFRGEISNIAKMQKRVEYDIEYLRNWSLRLDLAIILRTVRIVLSGDRHAY
jgi:putative colanic acid biosynthesis UDP-glucose lipid carrier transferase